MLCKTFDLLRNSPSSVPMYADEGELLVFGASLTSANLSKKYYASLGRFFIVRLMRLRFSSTSSTITFTISPT